MLATNMNNLSKESPLEEDVGARVTDLIWELSEKENVDFRNSTVEKCLGDVFSADLVKYNKAKSDIMRSLQGELLLRTHSFEKYLDSKVSDNKFHALLCVIGMLGPKEDVLIKLMIFGVWFFLYYYRTLCSHKDKPEGKTELGRSVLLPFVLCFQLRVDDWVHLASLILGQELEEGYKPGEVTPGAAMTVIVSSGVQAVVVIFSLAYLQIKLPKKQNVESSIALINIAQSRPLHSDWADLWHTPFVYVQIGLLSTCLFCGVGSSMVKTIIIMNCLFWSLCILVDFFTIDTDYTIENFRLSANIFIMSAGSIFLALLNRSPVIWRKEYGPTFVASVIKIKELRKLQRMRDKEEYISFVRQTDGSGKTVYALNSFLEDADMANINWHMMTNRKCIAIGSCVAVLCVVLCVVVASVMSSPKDGFFEMSTNKAVVLTLFFNMVLVPVVSVCVMILFDSTTTGFRTLIKTLAVQFASFMIWTAHSSQWSLNLVIGLMDLLQSGSFYLTNRFLPKMSITDMQLTLIFFILTATLAESQIASQIKIVGIFNVLQLRYYTNDWNLGWLYWAAMCLCGVGVIIQSQYIATKFVIGIWMVVEIYGRCYGCENEPYIGERSCGFKYSIVSENV